MRLVGLRKLYRNLGRELEELPLTVTNHNKVVAVIMDKDEYLRLKKQVVNTNFDIKEK